MAAGYKPGPGLVPSDCMGSVAALFFAFCHLSLEFGGAVGMLLSVDSPQAAAAIWPESHFHEQVNH